MSASYVPERGDLVWLEFTPQAGSEQRGRRPALVLSPKAYNGKVGLALFCPVTSKIKGYPFEVSRMDSTAPAKPVLSRGLQITGRDRLMGAQTSPASLTIPFGSNIRSSGAETR